MSDDDQTLRQRRPLPRIQTSEDRDLAARRTRHPLEIPIVVPPPSAHDFDAGDVTSPYDLLEREPGVEVREVVERSPRNAGDAATYEDIVKLAVALTKERSGNRARERDAEVVLSAPRQAARSSRRYLIATVVAAAASIASSVVGSVAKSKEPPPSSSPPAAVERSPANADAVRDQLQHEIDRLDTELQAIRAQLGGRHSDRLNYLVPPDPAVLSSVSTSKGTQP